MEMIMFKKNTVSTYPEKKPDFDQSESGFLFTLYEIIRSPEQLPHPIPL